MRTERLLPLAVTLAAVLAGCNSARPVEERAGSCTGCHGGVDNETGAPPFDLAGNRTGSAVGAHTQHIAGGVACESCHVVPAVVSSPGHIDGDNRAEVVFGGKALLKGATPTYAPVASPGKGGTCNGTYCHGSTLNAGGQTPNPVWTDVFTGGRCQQCHGFPPPPNHPQNPDCSACHPTTVNADETLKVGGTHLDGEVNVGSVHPASWVAPAGQLQPHGLAANHHDPSWPNGLTDCKSCHGADLGGGTSGGLTAPSCGSCHTWPPVVAGTAAVDCTFCHGSATRPSAVAANKAAPPVDTQGRALATDRGVGAHLAHLEVQALSTNVACGSCHAGQPYVDIAHDDGQVAVALVQPGTTTASGTFAPATGTCASTYCHGNFRAGATTNTPAWTAAGTQSTCDSCHKPQSGAAGTGYSDAHDFHVRSQGFGCAACHDGAYTASTVNRTLHANGTKDVIAAPRYDAAGTHTCSASCHNGSFAASPSPPWY